MDNSHTLIVNTDKIIADISGKPVGINVNYLRDEDENLSNARPLVDALKEMGVAHLRYPGGEKSDFHLFSTPPYDKSVSQVYGWYKDQTEGYRIMSSKGSMLCLSGSGPEDKNPTWSSLASVSVNEDMLHDIELPAVSITVIDLE